MHVFTSFEMSYQEHESEHGRSFGDVLKFPIIWDAYSPVSLRNELCHGPFQNSFDVHEEWGHTTLQTQSEHTTPRYHLTRGM